MNSLVLLATSRTYKAAEYELAYWFQSIFLVRDCKLIPNLIQHKHVDGCDRKLEPEILIDKESNKSNFDCKTCESVSLCLIP